MLHAVGAEVQVPVAQSYRFVGLRSGVERERRRLRAREDLDLAVAELDLARRQPGVHLVLRTKPHGPRHAEHLLCPQLAGPVDHALDDPGVVAEIHECKVLAVLAPARQPTANADCPP